MSASHTIFDSYSRATAPDFSADLQALPSVGTIWSRIKSRFNHWIQASVQAEAVSRLWDTAKTETRAVAGQEPSRVAPHAPSMAPAPALMRLANRADAQPLSDGWGSLLAHAYQTRFHSNGSQIA